LSGALIGFAAALVVALAMSHPVPLPLEPFDTFDLIVFAASLIPLTLPLVFCLAFVPSYRGFTFVKVHAAIIIAVALIASIRGPHDKGGVAFILLCALPAHVPAAISWIMTDRQRAGPPWLFTALTLAFTIGGGIGGAIP